MDKEKKWSRVCPKCNKELKYVSKNNRDASQKKSTFCTSCTRTGRKLSAEWKKKIGISIKGKLNGMYGKHHTIKTKKQLSKISKNWFSINVHPFTGKHHSKKSKKKMSDARKGKHLSKETRKRMSNAQTGRHHSEETKRKMHEMRLGNKNGFYGKKHTIESRKKMRMITISRLQERFGGGVCPTYNPTACKIIDEYGKKNGYTFQHALNGGEYFVKRLGYWVDGYDKEKNVVIEYYETRHIQPKNKKHDDLRKQEIINCLDCEFIELKEWNLPKELRNII